jgi:hypothetical protein
LALIPEDTGERINDSLVSPIPNVLLLNTGSGWLVSGAMVREIAIQSSLKCKGTTGWMLRTFWARALRQATRPRSTKLFRCNVFGKQWRKKAAP